MIEKLAELMDGSTVLYETVGEDGQPVLRCTGKLRTDEVAWLRENRDAVLEAIRAGPPAEPPSHLRHKVRGWSDNTAASWAWYEWTSRRIRPRLPRVRDALRAVYVCWKAKQ